MCAYYSTAVWGVPGVVAVCPWQQIGHGREEVVDSDTDDHIVIDADVSGDHHHSIANT